VPVLKMKYGSQVAKLGDRGKLVISRWLAEQVALRGLGSCQRLHALSSLSGESNGSGPDTSHSRHTSRLAHNDKVKRHRSTNTHGHPGTRLCRRVSIS
jgi:hypothetical protein